MARNLMVSRRRAEGHHWQAQCRDQRHPRRTRYEAAPGRTPGELLIQTPEAFGEQIAVETEKWRRVVELAGLKVE
jgi:hypothetical protein